MFGSGWHGVDHDHFVVTFDEADLEESAASVAADGDEDVVVVLDLPGVPQGVADVFIVDAVAACARLDLHVDNATLSTTL
jgi:hypothetical protein